MCIPKVRVHSWTTLTGTSLLLAAHTLVVGAILDEGTAYTRLTALLAVPFAVSILAGFIASFSASARLRATTSTAALVSAVAPAAVLLGYFGAGLLYLPGITILLIDVCTNAIIIRRVAGVLIALATGVATGLMFLLSYWPLVAAYDSCDHLDRGGTWECIPALSPQGVATGFVIIGAAAVLPWLAITVLSHFRTRDDSASIPPQISA